MPRPQRRRRVCSEPEHVCFEPQGYALAEETVLTVDEFETIRLMDLEGLSQEQCAGQMEVARTTVTGIYDSARRKIADALVNGKRIVIAGGSYRLCGGGNAMCRGRKCLLDGECAVPFGKGEKIMRIAATYENGNIFQYFGRTSQFKVYDIEDGKVIASAVIDTNGSGHGALAAFLVVNGVDALICGGIGGGAQMALMQAGVKLYGGVSGSADDAVNALLAGDLGYDPNVKCDHHDHEHGEGHVCGEHGEGHVCGEHGCGKHECGNH